MADGKPSSESSKAGQYELIDRLYEVAVDPSRYEALLDRWEAMIAPQRASAHERPAPALRLASLTSHVERADQVLDRLLQDDRPKGAYAVIEQIDRAAAFAVDRTLRVIACNAPAAELLDLQIGAALSELPLGDGDAYQLALHAGRLFNSNQADPVVLRGRTANNERLVVFHLRLVRSDTDDPYVTIVSSELRWPNGFTAMLRNAFDLSPAEAKVVRALTEGKTLQQAADSRGRSIDTIRAQLKSIMAKTETRSQTELVRLTLSTMEIVQYSDQANDAGEAPSEGFAALQPRTFQKLKLADGRRMDYLILGDPNGAPLVYLPQDFGLVRWPASAETYAEEQGIQVIVPVRPGYRKSTSLPRRTPYSNQLADDMAALLDHLGIDAAPILSVGGDSHIAAVFHSLHPERMTALVASAGVLPLTRPEQYNRMDKWHRFILAGARYTPHLLPFMVKAGFALAKRLGKRGFINAVYGNSEADMQTAADPEAFEAMVVGSEVCLSETHSAHDAYAREIIVQETSDWSEQALTMRGKIPVIFMNGLQDPQVPPETLAEFKQDYPWITFDVFPDGGQLLFFSKWNVVLDRLRPFLKN